MSDGAAPERVTDRAPPAHRGRPGAGPGPEPRRVHLDDLKVLLIAAVIVIHALLGYASLVVAWTYTELREVLERKGTRRFVLDRLLRLGVPFLVYVLLAQPVPVYALEHPLGRAPGSFRNEYGGAEHRLDTGPLWFVGVLLVFSLGHTLGRWARSGRPGPPHEPRVITWRTLTASALVVAPASFAVRLVYPHGSEIGVSDPNFWEWPACFAVFALGTHAARLGWLDRVPAGLGRTCRTVTLVAALAVAALLTLIAQPDAVDLALAVALRPLGVPAEVKATVVTVGALAGSFGAARLLVSRVPVVARIL